MNILLFAAWLALSSVHIAVPLAYFAGMKRASSRKVAGSIQLVEGEEPTVSILIPTFNEASVIEKKLRNIAQIEYPLKRLQVILVDGGSGDGTAEIARRTLQETNLNGSVLEEGERKGKAAGLNSGLKVATGQLLCISDAECQWDRMALRNAAAYLVNPSIGSVSGVHEIQNPHETISTGVENSYRSVYRMLRVAESKIHSTPVAEGELQLFRRTDLSEFDTSIGGDDTDAALSMVSKGLRAISAQDVVFFEPTPTSWGSRFSQKTRRGQHVLQAFLKHRGLLFRDNSPFSRMIFPMEFFLYAINPLLFVPFIALTILALIDLPILLTPALAGIVIIIISPSLRQTGLTYVSNNLTMLGALFQEARGAKQLLWTKIEETRRV